MTLPRDGRPIMAFQAHDTRDTAATRLYAATGSLTASRFIMAAHRGAGQADGPLYRSAAGARRQGRHRPQQLLRPPRHHDLEHIQNMRGRINPDRTSHVRICSECNIVKTVTYSNIYARNPSGGTRHRHKSLTIFALS